MFDIVLTPEALLALLTLTSLEIVLGIDNIVFIAIMVNRLPVVQRTLAYRLGLGAALITRLLLLFAISWIMGLTADLFTVMDKGISGRDIIMIGGGIFLIGKSTHEVFEKMESPHEEHQEGEGEGEGKGSASFAIVIFQIMLIDIVFSLDSVITAVGMAEELWVMVVAMVTAVMVMMLFAESIGNFVNRRPSMQVLALSFLMLIGVLLVAEGFDQHINKGYIYFAMAFSFLVEILNIRIRKVQQPVDLHNPEFPEQDSASQN